MKYLMEIREKVSMSLWMLLVGILRFKIFLVVALCMMPLILTITVLGLKLSIIVTTLFNCY